MVSHEYGPRNNLPPYVCIPNQPNEFAGTGYLSSSFGPFSLGADPAADGFTVRDLNLPGGVDDDPLRAPPLGAGRGQRPLRQARKSPTRSAAMDTFYDRAYSLISSQEAREAFNIDAEPAAIRDEYGRNEAGQRMLMARRLVAAGVRFVTLTYGGWDMHANIAGGHARQHAGLRPGLRRADPRSGSHRACLNETLVMVSSEFGRTPKINGTAGRDHWPKVFSVVLAGGGIKRGSIYGSSNAAASRAGERRDRPGRPGHHHLPPAGHHRRQGTDGPRQSADRNRRRRQGSQGTAGLAIRRGVGRCDCRRRTRAPIRRRQRRSRFVAAARHSSED